jgi:hypothetical protein
MVLSRCVVFTGLKEGENRAEKNEKKRKKKNKKIGSPAPSSVSSLSLFQPIEAAAIPSCICEGATRAPAFVRSRLTGTM